VQPPTVVLADDHAPMRAVVRTVLERRGFVVLAEAGSGPEAVDLVVAHRPDVCVIDNQMPGGDGISAIAALRVRMPGTRCVMLTASYGDANLRSAIEAGAVGYLSKTMDLARLPDALMGVLYGQAAVPRTVR
jgi:DNA-binding NarL/FixJ family response regulator